LIKVTIFDLLIFLQARRVGLVVVDVEVVALAGEPKLAVVLLVFDDVNLKQQKKPPRFGKDFKLSKFLT
jgi:hypothetical protein